MQRMLINRVSLGLALVLATIASSHAAVYCPPGTGLKNFDFFGFLGGILGGNSSEAAEPSCKPCGTWEASRGGFDAKCELCVPLLSAPNMFKTGCDCLPGTYVGAAPAEGSVAKNCIPCEGASVSFTKNAASCYTCPEGTVSGKNNLCSCPTGYKATGVNVNGATGCAKCPAGLVSPGGLSDTCTACPETSVPLSTGDFCGCLPGTRLNSSEPFSCAPCTSVFEYSSAPNRLLMCKQCFPFSYANEDHTECECTGGYYAVDPSVQPVQCKPCPAGTFKALPGNGDVSSCIACPEGLEPSGSAKSCVVPPCPAGTETAADGSCIPCDELSVNHRRGGTCQPCTNNTAASPDRTKCDMCLHGYLQTSDSGEALACMACMPGWTWNTETSKCDLDLVGDQHAAKVSEVPDDDAWKQHIGQPVTAPGASVAAPRLLPAPKRYATGQTLSSNELVAQSVFKRGEPEPPVRPLEGEESTLQTGVVKSVTIVDSKNHTKTTTKTSS